MNNPFTWDEYKAWRALEIEERYPEAKSKYKRGDVRSIWVRGGGQCRAIPITLIDFVIVKQYHGNYGWRILWAVYCGEDEKDIVFLTEEDIDNRRNYRIRDPYERLFLE